MDASPVSERTLAAVVARLPMNLRHRKPAMAIRIIFRLLCSSRLMAAQWRGFDAGLVGRHRLALCGRSEPAWGEDTVPL